MAPRARHSTERPAYGAYDADEHYAHGELLPGERIGPPLHRSGHRAMLRGIVILIALGGGWVLLGGQASWPEWLSAEITAVLSSTDRGMPKPDEPVRSAMATTSPPAERVTKQVEATPSSPQPAASGQAVIAPDATAALLAPPKTTAGVPPAAAESDEPPAGPLPPPTVDPADPLQMRAVAVGLHPDLSRVLLERLSPTDYRNAGIAIQTAVAETPDSAVFVWPRQRKPELALFHVRFVPGAAPSCRRYVVTVTKDGWLTTAPPMERCGPQPERPRRE